MRLDTQVPNENNAAHICECIKMAVRSLTRIYATQEKHMLETKDDNDYHACIETFVAIIVQCLNSSTFKDKRYCHASLIVLSSLGQLMERHAPSKVQAKRLGVMTTVVYYMTIDDSSSNTCLMIETPPMEKATISNSSSNNNYKKTDKDKGVSDSNHKSTTTTMTAAALETKTKEKVAETQSPLAVVDPVVAEAQAALKDEVRARMHALYGQVRDAAEKLLHICITREDDLKKKKVVGDDDDVNDATVDVVDERILSTSDDSHGG
jgi:hypothetical protein